MNGQRVRLLRIEAHERYDDGERAWDEQQRSSFYRRLKDKWTRTKRVS